MAKRVATGLLIEALPHTANLTINAFDKVRFDLDTTSRKRRVYQIHESASSHYEAKGIQVNIAIWNMHLEEDHHFEDILKSKLCKMGKGGGFRVVVFRGKGWLQNNGEGGIANWYCSGNQQREDNVIRFEAR